MVTRTHVERPALTAQWTRWETFNKPHLELDNSDKSLISPVVVDCKKKAFDTIKAEIHHIFPRACGAAVISHNYSTSQRWQIQRGSAQHKHVPPGGLVTRGKGSRAQRAKLPEQEEQSNTEKHQENKGFVYRILAEKMTESRAESADSHVDAVPTRRSCGLVSRNRAYLIYRHRLSVSASQRLSVSASLRTCSSVFQPVEIRGNVSQRRGW